MFKDEMMRTAMNKAMATGTFYGFDRKIRLNVIATKMKAYLDRQNTGVTKEEIDAYVSEKLGVLEKTMNRYSDLKEAA